MQREEEKEDRPCSTEEVKRLKTEEGEETLESELSSRSPRISVLPDRLQQPITANDLTELLHYAALGKTAGVDQPSWCRLQHQKKVKAVNVVMIEGLTQSHFYKHYLTLQHLRTNYSTRVTFTPSSTDLASGIFSSEVPEPDDPSVSQRHNGSSDLPKGLRIHPVITKFGTKRRGLTAYVLPEEEMVKKRWPVKGMPDFQDFVCTDSVDCVTDSSPLYGLDCEMTRLKTLLPSDAVLVGHSLNNDLVALKLIHPHVIDTSLLYRREFGQRFKLKVITESVLKFPDVLQRHGRSVAFLGKRSDIALDLSNQQDLCVVLAGPLPSGSSEQEVRRLFCCCGPLRNIKMLNTSVRVHAEVEFELLEGAELAVKTLNGLNMQGQSIKVQRPVYESMLDADLTLAALMCDNNSHLYAVKLNPGMADSVHMSARVHGHTLNAKCSDVTSVKKVNGQHSQPKTKSKLSEETVRETFGLFGSVERVALLQQSGKHARHAIIRFESSEGKRAALSSSEDLRKENYLVCPSLTPHHLPSWTAVTTPTTSVDPDKDEERSHMHISSQDEEMDLLMGKLDRRLQKLFRYLPEGTLSVVVLLGHTSDHGLLPGLCLMEVKQES
ncbi:hypothetical protein F7725_005947 [Dissostichus mawsoni]|uniref:RRM domain-containing protein n=1 Tax=Dissostichus mawsoni TaxID=36200 RepID=A0A7J5YSP3_DISMA|nr:hypothetical protein F7725_005947 [Dissostichus mawsoni]